MIGVGIDLGASSTKGIAIQVLGNGDMSLLEAMVIPSAQMPIRAGELAAALGKHRASPFTRPPLFLCVSNPDTVFDRVRIPLAAETGEVTGERIRGWLAEGTIRAPGSTQVQADLWDFQTLQVFRRATDVAQLGGKYADGLFVRIPQAVADAKFPSFSPLKVRGIEPSAVAVLNACLHLAPPAKGQPTLIMNLGSHSVHGVLVTDGTVIRVATASLGELAGTVEKLGRLEAGKADERIQNADLGESDAVNVEIKNAVTKALQSIKTGIEGERASAPFRPQRILLCGGLASVRGMTRLVSLVLESQADLLAQPERLRTSLTLPALFPIFAGALGAALRSAGVAPIALLPRKQVPRPARATVKGGERGAPPSGGEAASARPALAIISRLTGWIQAGLQTIKNVPQQLGWGWVAIGIVALVMTMPTWQYLDEGTEISKKQRELALLEPATRELDRQNDLINQYIMLTGSGGLSLLPWGAIITEVASQLPWGIYLTSVSANPDRLLLTGRMEGTPGSRIKQIVDRLKKAPILKRLGLTPL